MNFYIDKYRYIGHDAAIKPDTVARRGSTEMSTDLMAWMIAGSIAEEREREVRRGAQARELRAALAAEHSATRGPGTVARLRSAILGLRRPARSVEPACCVA